MEAVDHVFRHFCNMWFGALGEVRLRLVLTIVLVPFLTTYFFSPCHVFTRLPVLHWLVSGNS